MSKPWQPYALHILDAIERIRHVQARGDLTADQVRCTTRRFAICKPCRKPPNSCRMR